MNATTMVPSREGSLQSPERHPIPWQQPEFYDSERLFLELERVFEICHGCRRCFNLCNAFPTLFDLADESQTMEIDGVDKRDFWKVVDHCYLCDLCFMTKCPYVPPHEWNVDFPHLMLRAKAVKARVRGRRLRDRLLTSTDFLGALVSRPFVAPLANWLNRLTLVRKVTERLAGIDRHAWLPPFSTARRPVAGGSETSSPEPLVGEEKSFVRAAGRTLGKVAVFRTCYGRNNEPELYEDLMAVLEHNRIPAVIVQGERCCGMPKLELGDLAAVARLKRDNMPRLMALIEDGFDILAPVPSCVLMFKQELPLMFPDDEDVRTLQGRIFDPFEYLWARHEGGQLALDFRHTLGRIDYHVACHLRVQNMGLKTRDVLELVPDTRVDPIERCSGHDGTYAVKVEFHPYAAKIAQPIVRRIADGVANAYASDCPMAGHHIGHGLADGSDAVHPLRLLREAYGI